MRLISVGSGVHRVALGACLRPEWIQYASRTDFFGVNSSGDPRCRTSNTPPNTTSPCRGVAHLAKRMVRAVTP